MAEVTAVQLVEAQQLALAKLQSRTTARQKRLIRTMLERFAGQLGSFRGGAWSEAHRTAVTRLLAEAVRQLGIEQKGAMRRDMRAVARVSQMFAATYLATLDRHYLGAVRPLRFDSLEWWEDTHKSIGKVRIRTYHRSFDRYGLSVTRAVEDELAQRIAVGEPWHFARKKVWAATRGVVGDRQWMVDRILRTEASAAWNGTQLAALQEEDDPDDRMLKKLVTHFDNVTGRDSVLLHGQTRPVDKPFFDSFHNITYMAPPNRPHDREVVVGWRKSYGDVFDDYDRETAVGYAPKVHGKRKALKGAENDPGDSDVTVPMQVTRRRPKRRPTFTKPDKKRREQQIASLRDQRAKLVVRLRDARRYSAHYRRVLEANPGEPGVIREALLTSSEMVRSLTGQVEQMSEWIRDLELMRTG